jgi:twinkle protein
MAEFIKDTLDFSAYMRATDPAVKVRKASAFGADLVAEFAHRDPRTKVAEMFSTKLRDRIEFRPGEVTCWAGYNGHRKSMFTGQVALDLIVAGYRTLMASFEMSPSRTLARMAKQTFAVSRPATASLEAFSRWTDGRLWMFDHVGRIDPETCIAVCRYFADELKGQHVFIDSMMMVCGSEESMDEQKQYVTDLVRMAQETGLHVHLITHCRKPQHGEGTPPTKYDLRGSAAISDQAHNVLTVWANKEKAHKLQIDPCDQAALALPDARVSVEKQRNGDYEGAVKLWFDRESLRFCDDRITTVEPYVLGAV